ncbi:hypothetical protein B0H10DRAFT_1961210 [Mycena sp. CBHHK59/15]|nr:hypothetical protein B0H10DRAFT_1961210 [Mycena sp. CBHHK59/15]
MDSSSKDSFSDSTFDGFSIKLQTAPLDTFAGLVGDATAARIRYLERRLGDTRIPLPHLPAQTTVTGPSSRPVIQNPSDHIHALPVHNLVPVHNNLGPGPALDPKDATYDQFLTTTVRTESLGSYCQAVGTLTFGDPHDPQNRKKTRDFRLEFDLGSSDLWVYGQDCQNPRICGPGYPKGSGSSGAMFWFCNPERSSQISKWLLRGSVLDGTIRSVQLLTRKPEYQLWHDFVYLHPYWGPPPPNEPQKAWLNLEFGVAIKVSPLFELAPTSGILGLGRRRSGVSSITIEGNPGDDYLIGKEPRRPIFSRAVDDKSGPWHNNLPLLGEEHWIIPSITKTLNGKAYTYPNGMAEVDTGASHIHGPNPAFPTYDLEGSAFCYVDDKFVKVFYSFIPGATTMKLGALDAIYHMIPVDSSAAPNVELDIGGHLFTLQHSFLPGSLQHDIANQMYYVGAIQSKTILFPGHQGNYNGPDLIGRVALINMQVVLHMPDKGPHTLSWRTKETHFTGPIPHDW